VRGPAKIGETGVCPTGQEVCPSFVGFNSEVDGAIIEKDAMVLHLARVARCVTIPSGRKVLSGKHVASQAEVDSKTAPVTEGDRAFIVGVIEVNVAFVEQYTALAADAMKLNGINYDPLDIRSLTRTPTCQLWPGSPRKMPLSVAALLAMCTSVITSPR
jgi:hypothetical protein